MKITIFESLTKKEAQGIIDAAEWVRAIRDGMYKPTVDRVRSMIKLGDKDKARDWKMKLAASVWAGDCRTGRFYKNTKDRTGCAVFDFDNLEEKQILAARQLLEVFPWIVTVHITASGRGLRVIANIGIVHIDVYRTAYETVAQRLHDITGLEPDMACKDFARASLASYDPDIYFNPAATVFPYDADSNPLNYVPATGPDTSEDFRYLNNPVTQAFAMGADADINSVINRFFSTNPYVEGSRNNTMLFLGKYLRWYGIQSWQLDEAIATACRRAVQPGITEKEIRTAILWGYNHGKEDPNTKTYKVQKVQKTPMYPFSPEEMRQKPDNQQSENSEEDEEDIINEFCAPIPDEVFDTLPDELRKLLVIAKDKRERDIILLSCIAVSSGLFPALRTMYGNQKNSPHLYMCFLARAGSGKGIAMFALILARQIQDELDRIYWEEKKEYEKKLLVWEMELKTAFREKRLPDINLKPEEPVRKTLLLQVNTSKSQMMHEMADAQAFGNILATSEIDAFAESLNTDFGKHAAEIRMFFHHESVGQSFKTDKEPISIAFPMLALMLMGTPEQLVNFIKTLEDGMYSRFMFYTMSSNYKWKSQSPLDGNGNIDVKTLFGDTGAKLKANFFRSLGKEIMINFTREQWDRHASIFQEELGLAAAESNPNVVAIVFRSGLIALRVAMVFCGYRIMEAGWNVTEYTCTDEDFDNAVCITLVCMGHSANISTMMNEVVKRRRLTNYYRLMPVLMKMKNEFRYSDFKNEAISSGLNESAAKRALKKYLETGLISRTSTGYRKTSLGRKGYMGEK